MFPAQRNPASTAKALLLSGLLLFVLLGGCTQQTAELQPVTGQVIVNGRPLPHAQVVLHSDDPGIPVAQGETNAEGNFLLSTANTHDGAMTGEFRVTVAYYQQIKVEGELRPGPNVLPFKYSDPIRTELRVSVHKGENNLPPISLRL